ncbi:hypothetical protein SAMN06265368_0325 [Cohaesibacter gelatinilyticus]|uniref:Uncharacterized protein n=1 Tax=Cohaesibacter gelatinilyticus TaxID=372072 RepID=A0A285N9P7_9HYPH|nr:hypothetical protein SAMN06265368_0325 [Cohaesibacter gelatinilyticus]
MGNENRAFIQAKPRLDFSRQGFVQAVKLVSVLFSDLDDLGAGDFQTKAFQTHIVTLFGSE